MVDILNGIYTGFHAGGCTHAFRPRPTTQESTSGDSGAGRRKPTWTRCVGADPWYDGQVVSLPTWPRQPQDAGRTRDQLVPDEQLLLLKGGGTPQRFRRTEMS